MSPSGHFEDEADAEYRLAGRWYEDRLENLGIEFFDAVDAAIANRRAAAGWHPGSANVTYVDAASEIRFSPLLTTGGSLGIGRAA